MTKHLFLILTILTGASSARASSFWPNNPTPPTSSDAQSVNLGLRFYSTSAGSVTGMRFYKGLSNTGTHVGTLWTGTGTKLASVTFANETASGWQQANFSAPIAITANTVYVVSYLDTKGGYAYTQYYNWTGLSADPLKISGANPGVYVYSTSTVFPTSTYASTNYFVDVLFTAGTTPPPPPPPPPTTSSLVAAYGFNETSGTTVSDSSGYGNNGTTTNTVWSTLGKNGGAISFNGSSSRVNIADSASLDLTSGMTLEAWVRPETLSGWDTVILKEQSANLIYALYANTDTNRPSAHVYVGGDIDTRGPSQLAANTWTHMASTYDGTTLKLFINGVQVSSRAVGGNILTSSGALRIGSNAVWGEYYSGLIDDVRVYNRALSAAEIQTDMATAVGGTITPPPATYTISGSISGAASVLVTRTGTSSGSVTTSGAYSFAGLVNGTYVLTPTKSGYTFSPNSATVVVNGASMTAPTFVATAVPPPATYTISGSVSGAASILVTLSGPSSGSVTTSGTYSFPGLANGTYVVSPSKSGYSFSPTSASVTVNGASVAAPTFVATANPVPIQHSVDLSWTASTSTNVVSYNVYRTAAAGGTYSKIATSASTSYTDSTVASGFTYYYVTTAVDNSGLESGYSNQATAIIPTP